VLLYPDKIGIDLNGNRDKDRYMNMKKFNALLWIIILSSNAAASATLTPATFNWSGVYVGGFLGGATGTSITATEPLRLDNNAYWYRPYHNSFGYNTSSSFTGGATLGYNWQFAHTPYLVGLEGEYGYLNEQGSSADSNQTRYAALPGNNLYEKSRSTMSIGNAYGYALIGGRIAYALNRTLFYLKSGTVFTKNQSSYNSVKTEDMAPVYLNISGSNNITGYGVGAGIEYALPYLANASVKIEYLYLGINKSQYVYGHCSCDFLWRTTEHINGIHTAKIGFNYNFG
jgi:outer membrane immunogenic protein